MCQVFELTQPRGRSIVASNLRQIVIRDGGKIPLNCPTCGATVTADNQFCSNCGNAIPSAQFAPSAVAIPGAPSAAPKTSGMAIASLVCGIVNIFPAFIVAIVLGHISLSQIRKSAGRLKGSGLAIAGLV